MFSRQVCPRILLGGVEVSDFGRDRCPVINEECQVNFGGGLRVDHGGLIQ